MGPPRDLVTPPRPGPQRSRHELQIPQLPPVLAQSRDLVTPPLDGVCRDHIRDSRLARPARERCAPGRGSSHSSGLGPAKQPDWRPCSRGDTPCLRSSADVRDCVGQGGTSARNTNTYAVPTAPWLLLDRVENCSPPGYAHAHRRSLKKTEIDPKKTRYRRGFEEDEGGRKCTFTPAES